MYKFKRIFKIDFCSLMHITFIIHINQNGPNCSIAKYICVNLYGVLLNCDDSFSFQNRMNVISIWYIHLQLEMFPKCTHIRNIWVWAHFRFLLEIIFGHTFDEFWLTEICVKMGQWAIDWKWRIHGFRAKCSAERQKKKLYILRTNYIWIETYQFNQSRFQCLAFS